MADAADRLEDTATDINDVIGVLREQAGKIAKTQEFETVHKFVIAASAITASVPCTKRGAGNLGPNLQAFMATSRRPLLKSEELTFSENFGALFSALEARGQIADLEFKKLGFASDMDPGCHVAGAHPVKSI